MDAQIHASLMVVQQIDHERQTVTPLMTEAAKLQDNWLTISRHCQTGDNKINMITSLDYAQLNQALIRDIALLLSQLNTLKARYIQEVEALENNRPKPLEDNPNQN